MSSDLKPCPFCGGDAELDPLQGYRAMDGVRIGNRTVVYCLSCSAEIGMCYADVPQTTPEDLTAYVVEQWNRRAEARADSAVPSSHVSETDGWKLVPLEPTDAMAVAAVNAALAAPSQLNGVNYWRAMIAASPVVPESSIAVLREALARLHAAVALPSRIDFRTIRERDEFNSAREAARSALAGTPK